MVSARTAIASIAVALLAGCTLRSAPPPESADRAIDVPEDVAGSDADRAKLRAYMRAVEARARRRHMDVYWINPPDASARADLDRLQQILDSQPPLPNPPNH